MNKLLLSILSVSIILVAAQTSHAVAIAAADLDFAISGKQNNSFNFDFTAQPVWTAGSQRSDNGSADANNQRVGRVFVDFQLNAAIIAAAQKPFATVTLDLTVLSIGGGVAGTPYTDGLDLRYLGTSPSDRDANTLWNTGGVGGLDQADIVLTSGPAGAYTILLSNPAVLANIASATAGTFLSFGLSNSVGVQSPAINPVGNSVAETYGFQLSQSLATYQLTVVNVPEPATASLALLGLGGLMMRRRRMA